MILLILFSRDTIGLSFSCLFEVLKCSSAQVLKWSSAQVLKCSSVQVLKYSSAQVCHGSGSASPKGFLLLLLFLLACMKNTGWDSAIRLVLTTALPEKMLLQRFGVVFNRTHTTAYSLWWLWSQDGSSLKMYLPWNWCSRPLSRSRRHRTQSLWTRLLKTFVTKWRMRATI